MIKQNKTSHARRGSSGSNRPEEHYISGTEIPKDFYITIKFDMQKFLEAPIIKWGEVLEAEFMATLASAKIRIREFRNRHRVFKYCGADPGDGFELNYCFAWCTTEDGVIQLLRLDMIPLGKRAIDAEIDWLDGKAQEPVK